MKLLNGGELASYIKERQARQVRHLQAEGQVPCLAIFYDNEDPVIMKYVELKKIYGEDIGVKMLIQKLPEDEEEMEVHLVTTLRVDAGGGHISRESPLGRAIFGRRAGETVTVQVNADVSYPVTIRAIRPGADDDSLPISQY